MPFVTAANAFACVIRTRASRGSSAAPPRVLQPAKQEVHVQQRVVAATVQPPDPPPQAQHQSESRSCDMYVTAFHLEQPRAQLRDCTPPSAVDASNSPLQQSESFLGRLML
eukprot:NODE_65_length_2284_cov_2.641992.p4 GENE.NODE_65_length_2284_cov_2.641992~~NODE_65_length_2284_cov_2.641992.p4  ORF type:complete len:111 (+),score=9.62 NODE_65_length_2284_cov_2.641992:1538-1870(+)